MYITNPAFLSLVGERFQNGHGHRHARNLQHHQSYYRRSQEDPGLCAFLLLFPPLPRSPVVLKLGCDPSLQYIATSATLHYKGSFLQAHVSAAKAAVDALFRGAFFPQPSLATFALLTFFLPQSRLSNTAPSEFASTSSPRDRSKGLKESLD